LEKLEPRVLQRYCEFASLSPPSHIVLFHFDGDQAWSNRTSNENAAQYKKLIKDPVQLIVDGRLKIHSANEPVADIMSRLCTMIPYYSIEAWLYQNTDKAIAIANESYHGKNVKKFTNWANDRESLDEVIKPKEIVCLGSKYNEKLASESFPAEAVMQVGKSFTACVEKLRQCK
jgi:hypothetical protein